MTLRIAPGFPAILAAGSIATPVETSAGSGDAFAAGHATSFCGRYEAPIIRPAIARRRVSRDICAGPRKLVTKRLTSWSVADRVQPPIKC